MEIQEIQEHEETLLAWLELDSPAQRRRFLEQHPILFDSRSDQLLVTLGDAPESPFEGTFLQSSLTLLQDARKRGGDTSAIRAAYVNRHSGFVLDLPDWLSALIEEVEASDDDSFKKERLLTALSWSQQEPDGLLPEMLAELSYQTAQAMEESSDAPAEALSRYEQALQTYTFDEYPFQYAKVAYQAGSVHQQITRTSNDPTLHIQQTIAYYEKVSTIWTRDTFANSWMSLQENYADALLDRYLFSGQTSDLEQAMQLLRGLLFSGLADASSTVGIAISLMRGSYFFWSLSRWKEDLDHSVRLGQIVRKYCLKLQTPHPGFSMLLNMLGTALRVSSVQQEQGQVEQSIEVQREALKYARSKDPLQSFYQADLSLGLSLRYLRTWQAADLEEALSLAQEAIHDETMSEHGRAFHYFVFGHCLMISYANTWLPGILDKAIEYLDKAIVCAPP